MRNLVLMSVIRRVSKRAREKLQKRFDSNEHLTTYTLAKETGVGDEVLKLKGTMGTHRAPALAAECTNFEAMICVYANSRVDPYGVVTVNERWDEVKLRYVTHPHHPL